MADAPPDSARIAQIAADTVGGAQRRLPPDLRLLARGVPVLYERLPGADVIAQGFPADILGFFTGSPYGTEFSGEMPESPRIILFLDNLWDFAENDPEIFREEVRITYLHELGHYFGWDEDELAARGLE
ncbi:MAG: metallopeptidase family protein [Verrucomicrobiota bacterium]